MIEAARTIPSATATVTTATTGGEPSPKPIAFALASAEEIPGAGARFEARTRQRRPLNRSHSRALFRHVALLASRRLARQANWHRRPLDGASYYCQPHTTHKTRERCRRC